MARPPRPRPPRQHPQPRRSKQHQNFGYGTCSGRVPHVPRDPQDVRLSFKPESRENYDEN